MAETTEPSMDASATLSPAELQSKLDHLKASATQQYSLKNYSAAAEFYSEAAEVQDLVNGEMSPENADLLYQYGRCLYHVGVSKSDVLGGKVAGNEEPKRKKRKTAAAPVTGANGDGVIAGALKSGEEKMGGIKEEREEDDSKEPVAKIDPERPYFQITGDENWEDEEDDEDDEDDGEGDEEEEEEEDDDFAIAYEILDVARVLLGRKLASLSSDASSPEARQIKERLADTHDLQAEIKLENEQFADAVADAKAALGFKLELFPQESGMIAEAHYKLAIALDFAAQAPPAEEGEKAAGEEEEGKGKGKGKEPVKEKEEEEDPPAAVNESMRAEAATEMEKAIASCQLRIQKEEAAGKPASSIPDIKSLVADMKNRLVDLRNPAQPLTAAAEVPDGADPLRGVLGAMLGASKAEQARKIQEATKGANDLSGLVKKRKAPKVEGEGEAKKAKVEEK